MPRKSRKQDTPTVESILQDCYTLRLENMVYLREALGVLIAEEQQRLEAEPDEWEVKREEKILRTGARGSMRILAASGSCPFLVIQMESGK